jgi:dolichyldiphosphatase
MNGKGYGMPSSHAQFLSYFALSLSLFLLIRHKPPSPSSLTHTERPYSHTPLTLPQKVFLSLCTFALAAAVAASRIYLNYHTPVQVAVGCVAGLGSGGAWFGVTELARREGWVGWALETWVGRMGRWRDLVVEEDLAEAGWRVWEERRGRRLAQREGVGVNGGEGKKGR